MHPERGIRFVHGVGEPVYEEGLVTRFVGTTLDITEQERLTQELHRQQAYLAQAQALQRYGELRLERFDRKLLLNSNVSVALSLFALTCE